MYKKRLVWFIQTVKLKRTLGSSKQKNQPVDTTDHQRRQASSNRFTKKCKFKKLQNLNSDQEINSKKKTFEYWRFGKLKFREIKKGSDFWKRILVTARIFL
ncbi:hypothetical protein CRE_04930 [Caenorhabditis remanei]|uniref:Uncharacterized protein n=1 Tax=Caenorhabditis remanei TaxID=31234 RepID=E3MNE6_CAERE|nr:hypothetical protein CRE_04930 [Caenorhabditis remanei]